MHILFVIYNAQDCGSVVSITRRQAEYMGSKGHSVQIISNQSGHWPGTERVLTGSERTRRERLAEYVVNGVCRRIPVGWKRFDARKLVAQKNFVRAAAGTVKTLLRTGASIDGIISCQHFCAPGLLSIKKKHAVPFVIVSHGDVFSHPASSFPVLSRQGFAEEMPRLAAWMQQLYDSRSSNPIFRLFRRICHELVTPVTRLMCYSDLLILKKKPAEVE